MKMQNREESSHAHEVRLEKHKKTISISKVEKSKRRTVPSMLCRMRLGCLI